MKKNLSFLGWALILTLPFLFVACSDDDVEPEPTPVQPMNIVEIAAGDAQFSTLVAALQQADLVSVLEGAGPFTVFAPTNDAFTAAGIDLTTISDEALKEVLLYHVLGGAKIASTDLADGQTYASTASTYGPDATQLSMLIEKGNGVVINGNTNVSTADVDATNGVIHIVDNVILPLDIVGHASANSNFTSLVGALVAADGDLVSVLSGDGPFTVFAPLNSAFAEIQSTVDGLTTEQLTKVLTYHVASGNVRSDVLSDAMEVSTVNAPEKFTVNISGSTVTLTDAAGGISTVALTDVQATNGVIHVLDKVIIPGNL